MLAVPNCSARELSLFPNDELLLDLHFDADHSRAVFTYFGARDATLDSMVRLCSWVVETFDLGHQVGVHPYFGLIDVLPLVQYGCDELTLQELARELSSLIEGMGVPVYVYGRAHPHERPLPELRRFLRTQPHRKHPTAGVVCLGIRDPLVAFNVQFNGPLDAARAVAKRVRVPEVRALGFELASRGQVQVSMNLIAPDRVGPKEAFDRVLALARERDLQLVDCEVVGLVPHPILEQLEGLPLHAPVRSIEQALAEKGIS